MTRMTFEEWLQTIGEDVCERCDSMKRWKEYMGECHGSPAYQYFEECEHQEDGISCPEYENYIDDLEEEMEVKERR